MMKTVIEKKRCTSCNGYLAKHLFYANTNMRDGYNNQCKECVKKRISKSNKDRKSVNFKAHNQPALDDFWNINDTAIYC